MLQVSASFSTIQEGKKLRSLPITHGKQLNVSTQTETFLVSVKYFTLSLTILWDANLKVFHVKHHSSVFPSLFLSVHVPFCNYVQMGKHSRL